MNTSYQPKWLRLPEALSYLVTSRSLSIVEAQSWLLRAMQDLLRGDPIRYPQQNMFQVQGYPMRWTRRGSPDWPMRLTLADINWDQSTIIGQHPIRIIDVDLLIEVSAAALSPDQEKAREAATPSGIQTNKQAALKAKCIDWIRRLPPTPPRAKPGVVADAMVTFPGLSERQALAAWDDAAPDAWKKPGPK